MTLIHYKRFILATAWYTHTYTHTWKQANNTVLTYPCCVRHTVWCVLPCSVLLHTILFWKSNGMAWNVCLTNYKPSFETNAVYWKDRRNIQESSKTERLKIIVVKKRKQKETTVELKTRTEPPHLTRVLCFVVYFSIKIWKENLVLLYFTSSHSHSFEVLRTESHALCKLAKCFTPVPGFVSHPPSLSPMPVCVVRSQWVFEKRINKCMNWRLESYIGN